jgi:uncharacterized damage-inducible protein DinB
MRDSAEQYRRWFEYEKDAHSKALKSLASVPEASRSSPAFAKAVDVLAHIAVARQMWLFRLGFAKEKPAKLFLEGASLADTIETLRAMHEAWTDYLRQLTDAEVERIFDYRSYEGIPFRNRVEDVLTQLFGHSLYHRGQIAMLVKTAGGQPAETDFIFWTREPIGVDHHI